MNHIWQYGIHTVITTQAWMMNANRLRYNYPPSIQLPWISFAIIVNVKDNQLETNEGQHEDGLLLLKMPLQPLKPGLDFHQNILQWKIWKNYFCWSVFNLFIIYLSPFGTPPLFSKPCETCSQALKLRKFETLPFLWLTGEGSRL